MSTKTVKPTKPLRCEDPLWDLAWLRCDILQRIERHRLTVQRHPRLAHEEFYIRIELGSVLRVLDNMPPKRRDRVVRESAKMLKSKKASDLRTLARPMESGVAK